MSLDDVHTLIKLHFDRIGSSSFFTTLQLSGTWNCVPVSTESYLSLDTHKHIGESLLDDGIVCAVDGGNATLFSSSSLHVEHIRVGFCYNVLGKVDGEVSRVTRFETAYLDLHLVILATKGVGYVCHIVQSGLHSSRLSFADNVFASFLGDLQKESHYAFDSQSLGDDPLISLCGIYRRELELALGCAILSCASDFVHTYSQGHLRALLLDGSLVGREKTERELLTRLDVLAKSSQCILVGFCKSTQLLMQNAQTAVYFLHQESPHSSFVTKHLAKEREGKVHIHFMRLHERSSFVFRVDLYDSHSDSALIQLGLLLSAYSRDISFLGYPYQLIRVDEVCRVSNEEIGYLRMRFMESFDELSRRQLIGMSRGSVAHSILDSRKF
jgi:hypothetical protein